jgi:outer membrane protein assembly factor BamB
MIALEIEKGREVWRWSEDAPALGASPMIYPIENQQHLVFKSLRMIVGLDPRSGRELWRILFKVPMNNTIVTPTIYNDLLITSDYQMGMYGWKIDEGPEGWTAEQLWRNHRVSMFTSTPVFSSELMIGFSHYRKGQLFGLDLVTGQILWRGEPRSGEHATLISCEKNQILVFLEDGSLVVGKVSRNRFQKVRSYDLAESANWSHPAVIGNHLIMREGPRLAVFSFN